MLPAEVYPAGLRARGYAIANIFSMAVGFATQYSALPMYRTMHGWVWIFFACCMLFAFLIVFFFYPETKGVRSLPTLKLRTSELTLNHQITLEEVEVVFGSGAGAVVKNALGRRASVTSGGVVPAESPTEDEATGTFKGVPKATRRLVKLPTST